MKLKDFLSIVTIPVVAASLCCLSPVIIVVFGLGSLSFATSLGMTLYEGYKWVFRGFGLILILISVVLYLRTSKGICTLDQAKRRRNEVINTLVVAVVGGVVGYTFFLYVVVHYIGVWLKIWT